MWRFLKRWTLPVAMSVGALLYLLFAYVPQLDESARWLEPVIDTIYPVFMFVILFVTFCKVDFHAMRLRRWHLWISLVQLVTVLLLVGAILQLRLEGDALILAEGVLTCVIAPTATAAAVVTTKLGGDLNGMTAYTFFSNFVAAILVPVFFPLMAHQDGGSGFPALFLQIFLKVCVILVLPMAAAYVVKHFMHRLHRRIVSVPDLSFYLWGCSLAIVTGVTMKHICHAGTTVGFLLLLALCALAVCVLQFAAGRFIGRRFGCAVDAGQALGQKNTVFAVWVASTYLSPLSSVGPGCYILWQNIINSAELLAVEKRR